MTLCSNEEFLNIVRTNSPTWVRLGDGLAYISIWTTPPNRLTFWDGAPSFITPPCQPPASLFSSPHLLTLQPPAACHQPPPLFPSRYYCHLFLPFPLELPQSRRLSSLPITSLLTLFTLQTSSTSSSTLPTLSSVTKPHQSQLLCQIHQ